jgi:hypothetical protein
LRLIGGILIYTGQPGEADSAEFCARIQWFVAQGKKFIDSWQAQLDGPRGQEGCQPRP